MKVDGDLETGPHHTVEDTGIALGRALDEALGDRSGIRRYGSAVVPMDEARASCAIDVSGRPFAAFEGDLPAEAVADFDSDLAEEFFRAVAGTAKLTVHVTVERGTNTHHMVEAAFKAFARALREAVSIDPDETRHPLDEGAAVTEVAILDYGMGNLRSVEKAFEHVGARADDHPRPRRGARGRRRGAARGGGDAEGDGGRARATASTSCCTSAATPGSPSSASAWACSSCSRARPSSAAPRGSACWRARWRRSTRAG